MRNFINRYPALKKWVLFVAHIGLPAIRIWHWGRYVRYLKDLIAYRARMPDGEEKVPVLDLYPCLNDRTATTGIDTHYFHSNIWAARRVFQSGAKAHVDVGSQVMYVGMLSVFAEVTFVDIRPLDVQLENFQSQQGSILQLPYPDNALRSLSCLHVAEHIGLGRYGDPIDPDGIRKACRELARVLAPGGNLYFAVPVGRPRVCFNAHRVLSVAQVIGMFPGLVLKEFSAIDDRGMFIQNAMITTLDQAEYGCGLFWLQKP